MLGAIGARATAAPNLLSATKIYLAQSLLQCHLLPRSQQFGILVSAATATTAASSIRSSAAVLLHRTLALGAEYRTNPTISHRRRRLGMGCLSRMGAKQTCVSDARLRRSGNIVIADNQRGWYASVQWALTGIPS